MELTGIPRQRCSLMFVSIENQVGKVAKEMGCEVFNKVKGRDGRESCCARPAEMVSRWVREWMFRQTLRLIRAIRHDFMLTCTAEESVDIEENNKK